MSICVKIDENCSHPNHATANVLDVDNLQFPDD